MTIEQKLVFGVEDVRGIRLECSRCHAALSFMLDQSVTIPELCPSCREPWSDTFHAGGQTAAQVTIQFIDAVKQIRCVQAELKPPTVMRFEFDVAPWMAAKAGNR